MTQCADLCKKYPHLIPYISDLDRVGFICTEDTYKYLTFTFGREATDNLFISLQLGKSEDVQPLVRLYISYLDKNIHSRQWVIKVFNTFEEAVCYLTTVDR